MAANQPPPGYYGNIPGQVVTTGQTPGQYVVQGGQGQHVVAHGAPQVIYGPQGAHPMMYGHPAAANQGRGFGRLQIQWMERPVVAGCPVGLEYLTRIDQLLVKQNIDLYELITGYERNNRYEIKNALGQTVYVANEDTDCCELSWCGAHRKFRIHIYDNMDHEVIEIKRQNRCHRKNCDRDLITVQAPPGETVGYVKQSRCSGVIHYTIMDAKENVVMNIIGPSCCYCYCPGDDIPFQVMSYDETVEVGRISKLWTNLAQEYFTDADNFGVQFPIDLDVKMKAVVLGAVFLIDFNFFERSKQSGR